MGRTLHGLGVINVDTNADLDTSNLANTDTSRRHSCFSHTFSNLPSKTKRQDDSGVSEENNKPRSQHTKFRKDNRNISKCGPSKRTFAELLEAGRQEAQLRVEGHDTAYSIGAGASSGRLREVRRLSDDPGRHGSGSVDAVGKNIEDGIRHTSSGREVGKNGQGHVHSGREDSYLSRSDEFEAIARRESPFDSAGRVRGEVCESHRTWACPKCSECSEGTSDEIGSNGEPSEVTRQIVRDTGKLKKSLEYIADYLENNPIVQNS